MSTNAVPARSEIARADTWNAESVFPSLQAWEDELAQLAQEADAFGRYRGRLGEGAALLCEALNVRDELRRRTSVVQIYAGFSYAVNTTDQVAAANNNRADSLIGRVQGAVAFVEPELLALGSETLAAWMDAEPRLAIYRHYLADLFRKQVHVRSAEVEELLGLLAEPFGGASSTHSLLTNADFRFRPAVGGSGRESAVTQGTWLKLMTDPDREVRRTAWESYHQPYLLHKNTLTSTLATSLKQNVLVTRARRHSSTLAASLYTNNIPVEVFHNLIRIFRQNVPTWHRYWRLRARLLKVDILQPYDVWAPLTSHATTVPFAQAVDWICEGLAPMGEAYVATLRKGCLEDRWVDRYPNQGKGAGAFSWGSQGTYPFIMMSYNDNMLSLSTLAHELGHSMHSYLTWQAQPAIYADYALFAAEVASNFHQAMVRGHLLATHPDQGFQINVIEEAMSNFYRYFLVMPTLARFELEVHERVERGMPLTANDLMALSGDLFAETYGDDMACDLDTIGMHWASYGHLFNDYYVYQYATGISGANALARRIRAGVPGAVDAYLGFLTAGASRYPIDALAAAGVDLATPEPVEAAFAVLADYVDRLERLTA